MYVSFPSHSFLQKPAVKHLCKPTLYEKLSEKGEKSPAYVLRVCENPLLLHPLSETKAALLERLASLIRKTFGRFSGPPFAREVRGRGKKKKKTSGKIWKLSEKLLIFATAFLKTEASRKGDDL